MEDIFAPRLFFELAKTTQHDFWSATQRGADYAEALETCRCTSYKAEYASGPVPEPVRCRYRCYLASEPEVLATATGICAEVIQKRSQMSVRPSRFYSKVIPYLRKRKYPPSQRLNSCSILNLMLSIAGFGEWRSAEKNRVFEVFRGFRVFFEVFEAC